MKSHLLSGLITLLIFPACNTHLSDYKDTINKIGFEISSGNLSSAKKMADSLRRAANNEKQLWEADSLFQIAERITVDFPVTGEELLEKLKKKPGFNITPDNIKKWEDAGWLEYRILDGEKKYFKLAASNLMLLMNFHLDRAARDSATARDSRIIFRRKQTENVIEASDYSQKPAVPVSMNITYSITVKPDAVPTGDTVRCWLPFPKENHQRQNEVYLLGLSNDEFFIIAPDSMIHRTIYLEKKAVKGEPVVFRISYRYTSSGQYFNPSGLNILPYDTKSALYKKYTSEQLPQICFTDNVKNAADRISGNEKNPYEIVRKIFYWFNENIPWAAALEYSIMPNIPDYVLLNKKGDCGMQSFLFMSMLRYKGIPVKWNSGWMVSPGAKDLHDWCEIYFEGTGWVPADISHNLQFSSDNRIREFYITGIDPYRLIISDGISGKLFPEKKFLRSDPFDFQRGEVEWSGGNLYFDQWDYNMDIEYLPN